MKTLTHFDNLRAGEQGAVIALGNFDGIHRGHQIVIDAALSVAKDLGAPAGVACFRPHPSQYFNPDCEPFRRLMSARMRGVILSEMGVDNLYELPFDKAMTQNG